jgi:hypothetical protein
MKRKDMISIATLALVMLVLAFPLGVWASSAYIDNFDSDPIGGGEVTSFTTGSAGLGLSYVGANVDYSYTSGQIIPYSITYPGEASTTITARDGGPFEFVSIYINNTYTGYPLTITGNGDEPFTINVASNSSGTFSPSGGNKKVDNVVIANVGPGYEEYNFDFDNVSVLMGLEEMHCGGVGSYTFTTQSNVAIQVTNTGTNLGCLKVSETASDHPNATGTIGGSGTKTGKYWTITALQSDQSTPATANYTLNLTLPHSISPDGNAKVCKYTGGAGYGWDCARSSSTGTTVTRNGIASLSDWAVGSNVGPTAVTITRLTARPGAASFFPPLGLVLVGLGSLFLRKQRSAASTR